MDKEAFFEILQSAIFCFEEMKEKEIIETTKFNPLIVEIGIKLCDYLKSIELKENIGK